MNERLNSIEKTLTLLDKLSEYPYEYSVTELSKILDINRTTLHRILDTLIENNYAIKDENSKKYRLGPITYKLGTAYLNSQASQTKVLEILNTIAKLSKESTGLAIRDGEKIISLYEIESHQTMKMKYTPGLLYSMNRGCYGKGIMAFYDKKRVEQLLDEQVFEKLQPNTLTKKDDILKEYDKIRKDGYVLSIEETFELAVAIGIPLRNAHNDVVACVAVSFFKKDNYLERIEEIKEILLEYKSELEKYLLGNV